MLIAGIVLTLIGAVLLTHSTIEMSRVSLGRLPTWSNPPQRSRGFLMRHAGGAGLAVFGGVLAGSSIGYWSVLVVLAAFLGEIVVLVNHSRNATTAPRSS